MRIHRLFHGDPLQDSLAKARDAGSRRILVALEDWLRLDIPRTGEFEWLVEVEWAQRAQLSAGFEDVHWLLIANGRERDLAEFRRSELWPVERFTLLVRPQRGFSFSALLQQLPSAEERPVYFEFQPWTPAQPFRLTAPEIRKFLRQASLRRPDVPIGGFPGLELWDDRLDRAFELEPLVGSQYESRIPGTQPEISVIIPSHDNGPFLGSVLLNLLAQDYRRDQFEIVVVDDGSVDDTRAIVEECIRPELGKVNFSYIYFAKQGAQFRAGIARNLGAKRSRGRLLLFLDSDIVVRPQFLSAMARASQTADVIQTKRYHLYPEVSHARLRYEDVNLETQCFIQEEAYRKPFYECDEWQALPQFWKYTCTYCLMMSKADFIAAGRFKRCYTTYGFEDVDLGFELVKLGKSFRLLHEKVLHLTPPTCDRSPLARHRLLSRTAKTFFRQHLDPQIYDDLKIFMWESPWWPRFKRTVTRGLYG